MKKLLTLLLTALLLTLGCEYQNQDNCWSRKYFFKNNFIVTTTGKNFSDATFFVDILSNKFLYFDKAELYISNKFINNFVLNRIEFRPVYYGNLEYKIITYNNGTISEIKTEDIYIDGDEIFNDIICY